MVSRFPSVRFAVACVLQISYNHISEIGLGLLSDMGCVYHLGEDFGTRISNNICHDVMSYDYGGCVIALHCVSIRFVSITYPE